MCNKIQITGAGGAEVTNNGDGTYTVDASRFKQEGYRFITSFAYLAKKLFLEKHIELVDFFQSNKNKERTAFCFLFPSKEESDKMVEECKAEIKAHKEKVSKRSNETITLKTDKITVEDLNNESN